MLLCASSPYARRGALHDTFKRYFGKDEPDILVWKAATREMNPTFSQAIVDRAIERDASNANAEYGAEFRSDIESFINREAIEAAITPRVLERPRIMGVRYSAFVDPSGGSADSMTLAISHTEDNHAVLDVIREVRPPFSPESVVEEFAKLLTSYGIKSVVGDRYGGEWPRERFREHQIDYVCSENAKSAIYGEFLPLINSKRVDLLDLPRLTAQICSLERRTARGGRDSIDHPPGAHDDIANAACGAIVLVSSRAAPMIITPEFAAEFAALTSRSRFSHAH
jgi:hypothetical protein